MRLIVGLGNPGKEYESTRHNAGFLALEKFREAHEFAGWKSMARIQSEMSRGEIFDEDVLLLKPQTFMNLSGVAVQKALSYYNLDPKDLWIVHDEIAFPLGTVRIAEQGSDGGHNGVASVIEALGTRSFVRLRIGIGPKATAEAKGSPRLERYVLQKFPKKDAALLKETLAISVQTLDKALTAGIAAAMQGVNTKRVADKI